MNKSIRKVDLVNLLNGSFVDLPSPKSLSYMWNFGSLLGVFLAFQIVTGLFLAIHYSCDVMLAFNSIVHIERDVNWGWMNRVIHSNGASIFFLLLYFHIGRGFYYGSFYLKNVWMSGVTIFLVSMGTAFLGYVLPWGQMSFWAATVITNLLSAVPYMGVMLVEWIWGGYAVGNPTLTRFFSFHFLFPFVMLGLVIMHLFFLHKSGSSNPMGLKSDVDSVVFHSLFVVSDVVGLVFVMFLLVLVSFEFPYLFMDVENFLCGDPLVTPVHIQPEWYFLFAYAILRSVPNKMGGVVALLLSVFVLYLFPFIMESRVKGNVLYFVSSILFWWFVAVWFLLTWGGSCVVEDPYILVSQVMSIAYFVLLLMMGVFYKAEDQVFG